MKLRWRKRPSATVLHFNVLMTFGSALPLAISSSRPVLSIGARQPVRAVLATAWFIEASSPAPGAPGGALDTDRSVYACVMPVRCAAKMQRESKPVSECDGPGRAAALKSRPDRQGICTRKRQDTERSVHSLIADGRTARYGE